MSSLLISLFIIISVLKSATAACEVNYSFQYKECNLECSDLGWGGQGILPGHAAREMATILHLLCGDTGDTLEYNLKFINCSFPGNRLEFDWFTDKPTVDFSSLSFNGTNIMSIQDGTIGKYDGFKNSLKNFEVIDSTLIRIMSQGMIRGATGFETNSLTWRNNGELEITEVELVVQMAQFLTNLNVGGIRVREVMNLVNMTGKCQPLKLRKLEIITYNNFEVDSGIQIFSKDIISAIDSPNLGMAHFDNASIYMFEDAQAIEPLARKNRLEYLGFNDNLLQNIPAGLFDPLLALANKVYVFLGGNPWHCDGNLQYLQNLLLNTSHNIYFDLDLIKCASPADQAGKKVIDADLSGDFISVLPAPRLNLLCII